MTNCVVSWTIVGAVSGAPSVCSTVVLVVWSSTTAGGVVLNTCSSEDDDVRSGSLAASDAASALTLSWTILVVVRLAPVIPPVIVIKVS